MKELNKKTLWKQALIIALVVVLVAVIATVAWVETYWSYIDEKVFNDHEPMNLDSVRVIINEDYINQFKAEEITIKDFGWNNIKNIEYFVHDDGFTTHYGIDISLIKEGERQVKKAIIHFNKLKFVKLAVYGEAFFPFPF